MLKKIFCTALLFLLVLLPLGEIVFAVPVRPLVTVIDGDGKFVCNKQIRYTNPYRQPAAQNPAFTKETAVISRSAGSKTRKVVKIAMEMLGHRYVYAASGPNSFDCSGFTMYVFKQVGINLPHVAADQYNMGQKISDRASLVPGDLVFFSYYGSADIRHVGIYIGDGKFIHASSKHGVITTDLDAPYYAKNYKGAVRLIR